MIRYAQAAAIVLFKPEEVPVKPIHIQVEPTDACNQDCVFCARSQVISSPRVMKLEEFQKIIDEIRPKKVTLSGYGEPLINKALPQMIAYAKAKGASVNTTSNMTLLRTEERARELIESGLDLINASIDAATAETYRAGRRMDAFEDVLAGIRRLLQMRAELKSVSPSVRISFVITKTNLHELSDFVKLAHSLGVDVAFFQMLQLTEIEDRRDRLISGVPYDTFKQALDEGYAIAQQLGVKTNLGNLLADLPRYWQKYDAGQMTDKQCNLPWFSMYITANGSVRPCCAFAPVNYNMGGSILEEDFNSIWNSKKYQKFRQALRNGQRPTKVCQACVPESIVDVARRIPYSPGFLK